MTGEPWWTSAADGPIPWGRIRSDYCLYFPLIHIDLNILSVSDQTCDMYNEQTNRFRGLVLTESSLTTWHWNNIRTIFLFKTQPPIKHILGMSVVFLWWVNIDFKFFTSIFVLRFPELQKKFCNVVQNKFVALFVHNIHKTPVLIK